MSAAGEYFESLSNAIGRAWNRFWFTSVDPLPLCALRIATGVLALLWYVGFSLDLERLFGPGGLLPLDMIKTWRTMPDGTTYGISVLDYVQDVRSLWIVYWLGFAVLVAFTVGLFSRVTSVLSLLVVISMLWRAPMLQGPTESVLAMLLFYVCLGPSGAYLSIDRRLQAGKRAAQERVRGAAPGAIQPSYTAAIALRLVQVHLVVIYAMMVVAKLRGDAWWSGMAVWWLAVNPDHRLIDLSMLRDTNRQWAMFLVNAWTHAIMLFEACFAVFIWDRLARPLLLALSVIMWGSLTLITGEVLFSLAMLAANLAFVPPEWLRPLVERRTQN